MNKQNFHIILIISLFLISSCSGGSSYDSENLNEFAQCITESGAKMYGAYWCSYCNSQKNMFDNSWEYIDYIECSLPNQEGQTQYCTEQGITGYPTWEFGDGTRLSGVLSFADLASKTDCQTPS